MYVSKSGFISVSREYSRKWCYIFLLLKQNNTGERFSFVTLCGSWLPGYRRPKGVLSVLSVTGDFKSSSDSWDCLKKKSKPTTKKLSIRRVHSLLFCWRWLPKNAQTPTSQYCRKIRKNYRMQGAEVWRSSPSVPDIFVAWGGAYLLITWLWLMTAKWKCLSLCLPAIWVLLLFLILLVKAVKWGYLKNTPNQQLLGRSEKQQNMQVYELFVSKYSLEMLNPGTQLHPACVGLGQGLGQLHAMASLPLTHHVHTCWHLML